MGLRTLNISGQELTPRQASELPKAVTYAAICKRMRSRPELSDNEIVFLPMMSKSACGKRGRSNTPFNNGKFRTGGMKL